MAFAARDVPALWDTKGSWMFHVKHKRKPFNANPFFPVGSRSRCDRALPVVSHETHPAEPRIGGSVGTLHFAVSRETGVRFLEPADGAAAKTAPDLSPPEFSPPQPRIPMSCKLRWLGTSEPLSGTPELRQFFCASHEPAARRNGCGRRNAALIARHSRGQRLAWRKRRSFPP